MNFLWSRTENATVFVLLIYVDVNILMVWYPNKYVWAQRNRWYLPFSLFPCFFRSYIFSLSIKWKCHEFSCQPAFQSRKNNNMIFNDRASKREQIQNKNDLHHKLGNICFCLSLNYTSNIECHPFYRFSFEFQRTMKGFEYIIGVCESSCEATNQRCQGFIDCHSVAREDTSFAVYINPFR